MIYQVRLGDWGGAEALSLLPPRGCAPLRYHELYNYSEIWLSNAGARLLFRVSDEEWKAVKAGEIVTKVVPSEDDVAWWLWLALAGWVYGAGLWERDASAAALGAVMLLNHTWGTVVLWGWLSGFRRRRWPLRSLALATLDAAIILPLGQVADGFGPYHLAGITVSLGIGALLLVFGAAIVTLTDAWVARLEQREQQQGGQS